MRSGKITDSLSEAAQKVMLQGFADQRTAVWISQAILDATGERVKERTVSRRAKEWRDAQEQFDRAKRQYAAMKAAGLDGVEMLQALAFDRLVENPGALTGADPIQFHSLGLEAEKVAMKRRELDLRARQIAIGEKKLALLEAREARAVAVLGSDKPELTAEERLREIREIYGLRN
jgi:hypothetical protein